MARIVEASAHPELADRCYTQEEMRKTLIEKFYELDEIHENAIDITADSVIAAATVMMTMSVSAARFRMPTCVTCLRASMLSSASMLKRRR